MHMSRTLKEDLLPKLQARYARRNREGKSRMLDELCEDYGFERKYAIRLLGNKLPAPTGQRKPGRRPRYPEIEPIVRTIWKHAEQPCGKLLAPALKHWLPFFEKHHGKLSAKLRRLVLQASPATLDRLLKSARVQAINELFREAWGPLHNFFIPTQKLKQKWRDGSHWRKRYEAGSTPYERLMKPGVLKPQARRELRDRYQSLDPFELSAEVERRLGGILPTAPAGN